MMGFCHTCNKPLKSMGIARHRAMHRDKKENCTITRSDGTFTWYYGSKPKPPEGNNAERYFQGTRE